MSNNHANRGKSLEKTVLELFKHYKQRGIHCQQNQPNKLYDGTIVERHGFDFQVFHNGTFVAFDAKSCALAKWPLDKAKLHQVKALYDIEQHSGEAFFLVYFTKLKQLVKFPASLVNQAIIDKQGSLSPDMGIQTKLDILGVL